MDRGGGAELNTLVGIEVGGNAVTDVAASGNTCVMEFCFVHDIPKDRSNMIRIIGFLFIDLTQQ